METEKYKNLPWWQKEMHKFFQPLLKSKVVQKIAEAPGIKQWLQVLDMATWQGRYLARKREREEELAKEQAMDIKWTYDYLIGSKAIKEQLWQQWLQYNPKINELIQAGKNVAELQNSIIGQQLANIEANMTQSWDQLSPSQRKAFKDFYDYKTQSLINFVKWGSAGKSILTDPNVTNYIAYRNKIEEAGTKLNFWEKAWGMLQGFISPYSMTIGALESVAGMITGDEKMKESAKRTMANYFGRTDIMEDPSQFTAGDMIGEYLGRQLWWMDFFPVAGSAFRWIKTMMKANKYGKAWEGLLEIWSKNFDKIGIDNFKNVFKTDEMLAKYAKESKFNINRATKEDMLKFIHDNPGIIKQLTERLSIQMDEKVDVIKEFGQSIDQYWKYFKYPRNIGKDIISSYYMMTPASLKIMGALFSAQVGTEAIGTLADSEKIRTVGGLFTNPINTITHMMNINKNFFLDKAFQEYADWYGYKSVTELKNLPDDDPLKMEIMKTADIMYNNTTVTQMLWWMPKTVIWKIVAGLGDSLLSFAWFATNLKIGKYGLDKIGVSIPEMLRPVDKEWKLSIKTFDDIEWMMDKVSNINKKQAILTKEMTNIVNKIQQWYQINPMEGMRISRLAEESYQKIIELQNIASEVYGIRAVNAVVEKYKDALDILLSNNASISARNIAVENMQQAHHDMMNMVENVSKIKWANQFRSELTKETNRFLMSVNTLLALKDAQGITNAVTRWAIKNTAKAYHSFWPAILNNEIALNISTLKDGLYMANTMNKAFNLLYKETKIVQEFFKERVGDKKWYQKTWLNKEIETAINQRLEQWLANLKGSSEYENLFQTIKSGIYNTLFEAMFLKYDKSAKNLDLIANDVLRHIFFKDIISKKTKLWKVLDKISKKKIDDSVLKDIKDWAMRLSDEYLGKLKKNLDSIEQSSLRNIKSIFQAIQWVSSIQRWLNTTMHIRAFLDLVEAPHQLEALGLSVAGKEMMQKLYETYKEWWDNDIVNFLKENSNQLENAMDMMDASTFVDYLIKSKDHIEDVFRQTDEALNKFEVEQQQILAIKQKIADVLNSVGNNISTIKTNVKVDPEDKTFIDTLKDIQNNIIDFKNKFTFDSAQKELSELSPWTIKSFDEISDQLKTPSYIVNLLQGRLKTDNSFKWQKWSTTLATGDILKIANESIGESNFINKILSAMWFDKEAKEYIASNKEKYWQIVWDLKNIYRRYKNAEIVKVEVHNISKPEDIEIKEDIVLKSDGIDNLGKLSNHIKYVTYKWLAPDVTAPELKTKTKKFFDALNKIVDSKNNVYILKNDTQADYIVIPKEKVREDVSEILWADVAAKYNDNQLGQYAIMKNMGLIERILQEDPDFLRNPDTEKRAQVIKNSQKYIKKMNANKIKDTKTRVSLILDDLWVQDWVIYLLSPDVKSLANKAGYDPEENASWFKANVNWKWFEVKWYFFFGNPERIKSMLQISNNKERALSFLAKHGITGVKTIDQITDSIILLANQGKLDAITLTSAIKDPMKWIEWYKGTIITNKEEIERPGIRIYTDISIKPKYNIIKLSHQYPQSIAWIRGEVFHETLKDYVEKDENSVLNVVNNILEALNKGDEKTAYTLIKDNFNNLLADDSKNIIDMTENNIFSVNSKNFQGILRTLIKNSFSSHSLKWYRALLKGLPKDVYDALQAKYWLTDGNIVVLSRKYLWKWWKQWEHILVGRDPVTGPKATIAAKVFMIEYLPNDIKKYFIIDGKPSQEIFTTGPALEKNMTQVLEWDYDWDRIYIYPEFSKLKPVRWEWNTIWDMMAEYTVQVQKIPSTWEVTSKAKRPEFKQIYGNYAYDYRIPWFAILNSKASVSLAASNARTASVLNRKIFDGAYKDDIEKIEQLNAFSKYIQEAVDGNLLKDKSTVLMDEVFRKLFPWLTAWEASILKKDFSTLFGFIKDETEGTTDTLKEYLFKIHNAQLALDRIIKLRAEKTGQEYSKLKKIAQTDPRIWINNFDKLNLKSYSPKDPNHFLNKIEQRLNNQKILQAWIIFDWFKQDWYDILRGVEYINKHNLRWWYDWRVRREMKSIDEKMFEALKNEDVAMFALASNNIHLFPIIEKIHPEMYAKYLLIQKHMTAQEWYINLMSDILNMQDKYKNIELRYFGRWRPELYRWKFIPALLSRGVEWGNEILKSLGLKTIDIVDKASVWKKSNLESAADKIAMENTKNPDILLESRENLKQEVTLRRAIGDYIEQQYRDIQANMYKHKHAHRIKNTLLYDMYEFYRSADSSILEKRDTPLKSYLRKLPNGEELYLNPKLPKYFEQVIGNIKNIMSADFLNKRLILEHTKETKNYDNDLMKSLKRNIKDLTYDAMKYLRATEATALHNTILDSMKDVQDIIFKDAMFVKNLSETMYTKVKAGMEFETARQEAIKEVSEKVSKNEIELLPATTNKIKDAMRGGLSQLGQVTNKIISDVSTQMRELATYTENPETLPKYIEAKMNSILIEKAQKEWIASNILGEFIATLNSIYKTTTLSYAFGRFFTEWANTLFQTYVPYFTSFFTGKWRRITTSEWFKQKMWWWDLFLSNLPELEKMSWKEITRMFPEYNKVTTKVFETWKQRPAEQKETFLQKIRFYLQRGWEFISKQDVKIANKRIPLWYEAVNEVMREKFFAHEFYTNLHDLIMKRAENNPKYINYIKRILSTDVMLSKKKLYHKKALFKEVERISTKNVKESFFDYANNPVWVAGLETYVPFANFFYNAIKMFAKNPLAWMTLMNTTSNIMQQFTYPEFDIDEESLRWYFNINKFSIGILGALWFANAWVDLKRFLPIDITNPKFFGYAYQKMFFPTNDPDYIKLMENDKFHWYNYAINKLAPVIGGFVESLNTGDQKMMMKKALYIFTGLSWTDTAKFDMLRHYYKKDYDFMLNKNEYYWNQFNVWREANGLPKITKADLMAKKYFEDLVFSGDSSWYEYLNIMADYITMTEFIKTKNNDIITDTDAADMVIKWVKGLLMDMVTPALREAVKDDKKLFEKAKEMADLTIDDTGQIKKRLGRERSILDLLNNMWTHKQFLERLNYYAKNYNVIKSFSEANANYRTDVGTATDIAKVAAFKYYFEEEENDPKRWQLEKSNLELYYKVKVEAIKNGTLRRPIQNQILDEVGSEWTLTEMYKEYLKYSKGIILNDLEKAKSNVNSYTLLRNMYWKQAKAAINEWERNYRRELARKASEEVRNERVRFERFSPTFYNLSQLRSMIKGMPSTFTEEMDAYKTAIKENTRTIFNNYYTGKKLRYNKFLKDKNAALRFKQKNGITIEEAIEQLDFEINSMSTQTTNDINFVSF